MNFKGLIKYPWRRFKRYRVGRGYSVHSPFAFYFITRVLRERLQFYCFKNEITTREWRRLFRVVNYFRPSTVCLLGNCPSMVRTTILKACPEVQFIDSPADADFTYSAIGIIPAKASVTYCAESTATPADAMTFSNGRILIAVRRHSLPHQHFTLSF